MVLHCIMEKTNIKTGEVESHLKAFHYEIQINLESTNTDEIYSEMMKTILERLATFQKSGSNWIFSSVVSLDIHTVKYKPLKVSSHIHLPKALKDKTAIINLQNTDVQCFKWSITRALNPKDTNPQRIDNELREQAEGFNWTGINFPTSWKDIDKFESQNETFSVNVFGYEAEIYPLRISKNTYKPGRGEPVNLLLITNEEKQHYCVIKNMSRLLASQTSKTKDKRYLCLRCLNSFPFKESLDKHIDYCKKHEAVKRHFQELARSSRSYPIKTIISL